MVRLFIGGGWRYDVCPSTDVGVVHISHRLPRRAPRLQKVDVMSGEVQTAAVGPPPGVSLRVRDEMMGRGKMEKAVRYDVWQLSSPPPTLDVWHRHRARVYGGLGVDPGQRVAPALVPLRGHLLLLPD